MTILIFVNKSQSVLFISFSGVSFLAIILQSFYALRSLNTNLSKMNYHKHRSYVMVKAVYISLNCIKLCFKTTDLHDPKDFSLYGIDLIWTMMEAYWWIILYLFCYRINLGYYDFFEGVFEMDNATSSAMLKKAIIIEVDGRKVKEIKEITNEIENSYSWGAALNEKKITNNKVFPITEKKKMVNFLFFTYFFIKFFSSSMILLIFTKLL